MPDPAIPEEKEKERKKGRFAFCKEMVIFMRIKGLLCPLTLLALSALLSFLLISCGTAPAEGEEQGTGVAPGADTLVTAIPAPPISAWETPETEAPPAPVEYRATFAAVGDAIVHEGVWMEAAKHARLGGEGRDYDFRYLFERVEGLIDGADLAFVNQETVMAGEEYGYSAYPRFNTPRALAYDLLDVGFDVVNIATNHMMDMLPEGLAATIDFWDTTDATLIGGYRSRDDYFTPRVVEVNNIRIAFLSYCYGTNGLSMPAGYEMVIPYLDEETVRRQTATAREMADFVFVSVHWGEDSAQPLTEQQKTFAKLFAECGVDVIIGHHPHLIQPVEWIEGEGGHRTLCAYSLGNIFSLMAKSRNMIGGILNLELSLCDGVAKIENVVFRPTMCHYNMNFFGQKIYLLEEYTEALASKHGTMNFGDRETYASLLAYTRDIISPEFLPEALREAP